MTLAVAIPSYHRTRILREKTLAYLERAGVAPEQVSVFVADEAELAAYRAGLDGRYADRLFVTAPGLTVSRRLAQEQHYAEDREIVWMDDDVASLRRRLNERETEEVTDLAALAAEAFGIARDIGAFLWGVYPIVNPFFMKPRVRTDLRHIVGSFYGVINRRDPFLLGLECGDAKEDYERSLRHFERDRQLLRLDYVAPKTAYYRAEGGIEDRTPASVEENVRALVARWPGMVRRNRRRKSGYPEILIG